MKQHVSHTGLRSLMLLCAILFGATLTWIVTTLPASSLGLAQPVQFNIVESGVSNPVTAVLLNFRAYDTLLEVAVLTLAMVAVRSFRAKPNPTLGQTVTEVQLGLVHILAPFTILYAAYLLWAGSDRPGGAFQGGAVLGALGVLMRLSVVRIHGRQRKRRSTLWLGLIGLAIFTLSGAWELCLGRQLLEYPPGTQGMMILLIESGAMISIGYILTELVCGETEGAAPS